MTALFLVPSAQGHLNRSFLVARQLKDQGYQVVYGYLGLPEMAKLIYQQGFAVQWLQSHPFGVGLDEVINEQKAESYLETLIDRFTNRTFHERTADLTRVIRELKPSLIVLDVFLSTDFIILYPLLVQYACRLVFLQNMLSTYDDGYTPPLNSSLIPGQHKPAAIRQAWKTVYRKRSFQHFIGGLKYFGLSRKRQIEQAFRRNNLPQKHRLRWDKAFHVGFDQVQEWIAAPQAFEFPGRTLLPFQRYLDTVADLTRIEERLPAYEKVINQIEQERLVNPLLKLLYVSLGTAQTTRKKGEEDRFFIRLYAVAKQHPDWQLVMAVGPALVQQLPKPPVNVFLFGSVPQLHILQRANGFVTHGGLNSVLEAILLRVPTLVYPISKQWDLPGYAARVAAHDIGLVGNFTKDDSTQITQHLDRLLTDPTIPIALTALNQRLEQATIIETEK